MVYLFMYTSDSYNTSLHSLHLNENENTLGIADRRGAEMKPFSMLQLYSKGNSRQVRSAWVYCPWGKGQTPLQSPFSFYPPKGVGSALHLKCLRNYQCYAT